MTNSFTPNCKMSGKWIDIRQVNRSSYIETNVDRSIGG
jgi:hypothetical protein